jgi:hypothetical protein
MVILSTKKSADGAARLVAHAVAALIGEVGQQPVHSRVVSRADDFPPVACLHDQAGAAQFGQVVSQRRSRLVEQTLDLADVEPVVSGPYEQAKQA